MTQNPQAPVHRQPWLHELSICVDGNATALSSTSGDMRPATAEGLYVDDARALSLLTVVVSGESPCPVAHGASGASAEFFASARNLGNPGADPSVEVRRSRRLQGPTMAEVVEVVSRASEPVACEVVVELAADGAPISAVKAGHVSHAAAAPIFVRPVAVDALAQDRRRIGERVVFEQRSDEHLSRQRNHGWRT